MENYATYLFFGGCVKLSLQHDKNRHTPIRTHYLPAKKICSCFHLQAIYKECKHLPFFLLSQYHLLNNQEGLSHWIHNPTISLLHLYFLDPIGLFLSPGFVALSSPIISDCYLTKCVLYWHCYSQALTLLEKLFGSSHSPQNPTLSCLPPTD